MQIHFCSYTLKFIRFFGCICCSSDPIHFLRCLAGHPNQQLYARPKDEVGPSFHPATPYMAQITEEGKIQTIAEEPVEEAVEIGRCCYVGR